MGTSTTERSWEGLVVMAMLVGLEVRIVVADMVVADLSLIDM